MEALTKATGKTFKTEQECKNWWDAEGSGMKWE